MEALNKQMPIFTCIPREKSQNNPPKYFTDFVEEQRKINQQIFDFIEEQRKINQQILSELKNLNSRIDNLVKKNNLKE